uniref:Transmembrane protein n=1 Tax=Steinernema glaseri TaxID=37863 RepID=A0A1I7ZNY9_9BILA
MSRQKRSKARKDNEKKQNPRRWTNGEEGKTTKRRKDEDDRRWPLGPETFRLATQTCLISLAVFLGFSYLGLLECQIVGRSHVGTVCPENG